MRLEPLQGRDGWNWLIAGWTTYRKQPMPIAVLTLMYLVMLSVLPGLIPVVGPFAMAVFTPGLTFGIVAACRLIDRGLPVSPMLLFSGFRDDNRRFAKPLIQLGFLYVACMLVVVLLVWLVTQGEAGAPEITGAVGDTKGTDASFLIKLILAFGVAYTPVMMMFWFAPMLVVWHEFKPAKAVFYSFFAVRRNWRAFLIYGMGWLLVLMIAALGLTILGEMLALPKVFMNAVQLTLVFVLLSVTVCTYYPSYTSVFDDGDKVASD